MFFSNKNIELLGPLDSLRPQQTTNQVTAQVSLMKMKINETKQIILVRLNDEVSLDLELDFLLAR